LAALGTDGICPEAKVNCFLCIYALLPPIFFSLKDPLYTAAVSPYFLVLFILDIVPVQLVADGDDAVFSTDTQTIGFRSETPPCTGIDWDLALRSR